ncbi:hypothetical protein Mesci_3809 [Mesorhizobium ciceri biovar biserrulae WSM1271]|uniref:Uncharacterized protein n=1 Tax=Mesorhizobium ciceri biovar biserrulae (strain HAMBI 2942 / LMG 23838 / WSM1271) TaxID=765698 RepID=E8T7S5_MESCW|nr:hypothetical protein Mesci_3809 [Mesorhizobium ciceri biovar biserrulae WSM1271]
MSRNTVLQFIAATVAVAVLAGIHQGLGWILDQMTTQFIYGAASASVVIFSVFAVAFWMEGSITFRGGKQKRPRDTIDL